MTATTPPRPGRYFTGGDLIDCANHLRDGGLDLVAVMDMWGPVYDLDTFEAEDAKEWFCCEFLLREEKASGEKEVSLQELIQAEREFNEGRDFPAEYKQDRRGWWRRRAPHRGRGTGHSPSRVGFRITTRKSLSVRWFKDRTIGAGPWVERLLSQHRLGWILERDFYTDLLAQCFEGFSEQAVCPERQLGFARHLAHDKKLHAINIMLKRNPRNEGLRAHLDQWGIALENPPSKKAPVEQMDLFGGQS